MARKVDATAAVVDEQTLIQGVAKYFLEKVYGPDGMPWETRFADLEELSRRPKITSAFPWYNELTPLSLHCREVRSNGQYQGEP